MTFKINRKRMVVTFSLSQRKNKCMAFSLMKRTYFGLNNGLNYLLSAVFLVTTCIMSITFGLLMNNSRHWESCLDPKETNGIKIKNKISYGLDVKSTPPPTARGLELSSPVGDATETELDGELLTSSDDQCTDGFTVEWAVRMWGPAEEIMSSGMPLKNMPGSWALSSVCSLSTMRGAAASATHSCHREPLTHHSLSSRFARSWTIPLNPQAKSILPPLSSFSQEFSQRNRNQLKV